jgi:hypothetical protein
LIYEFGSFRLDSTERLLLRAGQPVSLTPKAFDLLVFLVDHAGRLVTKQALMSALWPNTFVEEANLTFTVSALRKALGDGQDGGRLDCPARIDGLWDVPLNVIYLDAETIAIDAPRPTRERSFD